MKTSNRPSVPGLCRTCEKAERCTYPNRDGHVVLHCLEFEEESMADPPAPRAWRMHAATGIGEVREQRRHP